MRYICDDPEHVKIETDGTIVCQHCYSAAKAKIKRLRSALIELRAELKAKRLRMIRDIHVIIDEALDE